MSIRVMTLVWDTCLYDGGTLLVLLALADWANDDGSKVHPGLDTLSAKCRLTVRAAQDCLKRLRQDRVIIAVDGARGGRSRVTEYRIDLERVKKLHGLHVAEFLADLDNPKGCKRCMERFRKGEIGDKKGCSSQQQNGEDDDVKGEDRVAYIDNHQEPSSEPSENRHSLAEREKDVLPSAEEGPPLEGPDPKAWAPAIMAAYREIPNPTGAGSEDEAQHRWDAIPWIERPTANEMVLCIDARKRQVVAGNLHRDPNKPEMSPHLQKWIKRRSYTEFLPAVRTAQQSVTSDRKAGKPSVILPPWAIAKMLEAGWDTTNIDAWLLGATVEAGPPVRLTVPMSVQKEHLSSGSYGQRLRRAFGDDVVIEVVRKTAS